MQGARFQTLVWELRSCMPHNTLHAPQNFPLQNYCMNSRTVAQSFRASISSSIKKKKLFPRLLWELNDVILKKTLAPWRNVTTNLDSILKKQRHYFANKSSYSQSYDFSSSHVWMCHGFEQRSVKVKTEEWLPINSWAFSWNLESQKWMFLGKFGLQSHKMTSKSSLFFNQPN